jgi:hypothetical protein
MSWVPPPGHGNPQYGDPGRHMHWDKRPSLASCFAHWLTHEGYMPRAEFWLTSPRLTELFHNLGSVPKGLQVVGLCRDCIRCQRQEAIYEDRDMAESLVICSEVMES